MLQTSLPRKAVAEGVGTFALVTAGCGAIMVDTQTHTLTHVGVALTFGLIIMVMIAATGHLSGAHFNPAVTIAFALTRHFPWRQVPFYILAQILGAVLGAVALRGLFGPIASLGATIPAGGVWQSFGLEVLLSAVLMMVIISVATDTRAVGQLAALAIGAAVTLDAMWGGPISGASMNPARSLGPALIAGAWQDQWVYIIAPIIGTCLSAALYQWLRATPDITPIEAIKKPDRA
ncbi:MIP family channel protein [Dictyobacter aurantiacus]|uniref:Aquaporin n=1 Tax=Dictyobacter aurantiacus TaxID=1936993 RepID=A0A401ZLK8_9CHLR|nr:MIP family channel protein [Dictyobacter aurantiacus]GCE07712.1 aquaporin [Dictyobacter aurantiacus]